MNGTPECVVPWHVHTSAERSKTCRYDEDDPQAAEHRRRVADAAAGDVSSALGMLEADGMREHFRGQAEALENVLRELRDAAR